jgi:CelD/BcsL family acetyltransferase involved in cellulose biosynthesis
VAQSTIQVARLPATWDEYLAPMHRDRRYRVRHLRRNALQKLEARMHVASTEAELSGAVDDLIKLHRARWDSKTDGQGAFRSQRYVAFHREVIGACHANGWIRFHRMEVAGKAAAVFYCYRYRDEVLYFQSGFDPSLQSFSIGQVLMGFAIETSIAEGARVFDLLKGDHGYKNSWSNDVRQTVDVVAHNTSALGRVGRLRRRVGVLKRWLLKGRRPPTPSLAGA